MSSSALNIQVNGEEAAKLLSKIHRYTGVYRTLSVKETLLAAAGKDPLVPNIRVDVESAGAVEVKRLKVLGADIISWQCQRDDKGTAIQRKKKLTSIRMVIGVPKQDFGWTARVVFIRELGKASVTEDVVPVDRFIFPIENIALPLALKNSFPSASFVSAIRVDRSPAGCRPADDLYRKQLRFVAHQMSVTEKSLGSGINSGDRVPLEIGWDGGVEIVNHCSIHVASHELVKFHRCVRPHQDFYFKLAKRAVDFRRFKQARGELTDFSKTTSHWAIDEDMKNETEKIRSEIHLSFTPN